MKVNPNSLLVVISAPSGAGKTTICEGVLAAQKNIVRAVTCTTRAPRDGERDGVDYYFLDAATFLKRVQAGKFLEHATVYGNSYGILKSEVVGKLRQGKDVLLNVDVQGAETIRAQARENEELHHALVEIFLAPTALSVLETRLKKRGKDSAAVIQKRLSVARQELAHWKQYDYLVISDSIEEDIRRVRGILEVEKMRTTRLQPPVYD